MKGGLQRSGKRKRRSTPSSSPSTRSVTATVSPEAKDKSNDVPGSSLVAAPHTPKRTRRQKIQTPAACLVSTPIHSSSSTILPDIPVFPTGAKHSELGTTELCTRSKTSEMNSPCNTSEMNSPCNTSNPRTRRRGVNASKAIQMKKRVTKEQTCTDTNGLPLKRRRSRPRKIKPGSLQEDITPNSSDRSIPRLKLEESDEAEKDESLLSSDLSIELSHHEEQLLNLSVQEEEESNEEDDELPSFLMEKDKKPATITRGVFVWHKYRNHPFWPALVKSVHQKGKKASILFIDDLTIPTKRGITVPLKVLKPFDCQEADELVCTAKEKYKEAIQWSLEIVKDYRFRIACRSFSGSFIEYFAHDMSYPVRRKYPNADSERLTIVEPMLLCDDLEENSFSEQQEEATRSSKRLLPDRSHAAYNRANEKLVHFIVKQRMVDERLLAVICGKQQSRWLRSFLRAKRIRVINVYLEDDQQLEQVYRYLHELYSTAVATGPCLAEVKSSESVPFILDVLLPEAIIYAIAGVDKVSVKKAEEKYLKGRCVSEREAQEFDLMIEHSVQKRLQSLGPGGS